MGEFIHKQLSYKILGMAFIVHNILEPGLLQKKPPSKMVVCAMESAYEGAFCIEFKKAGIPFSRQKVYPLYSGKSHHIFFCLKREAGIGGFFLHVLPFGHSPHTTGIAGGMRI